jgi:ribosomal protein S19E (S16A)
MGQANNVVRFLKENVEKSVGVVDCLGDLNTFYGMRYYTWCDNNGIEEKMRKKKQHFIKDLENLGYVVKKGGGNVMKIYGGKILASADDLVDDFDEV